MTIDHHDLMHSSFSSTTVSLLFNPELTSGHNHSCNNFFHHGIQPGLIELRGQLFTHCFHFFWLTLALSGSLRQCNSGSFLLIVALKVLARFATPQLRSPSLYLCQELGGFCDLHHRLYMRRCWFVALRLAQ